MSDDSPSVSDAPTSWPIFRAVVDGDLAALNDLLHVVVGAPDIDLEVRSRRGRTPLMLACLHRQSEAASMLLEAGASALATIEEPTALRLVPGTRSDRSSHDLASDDASEEAVDSGVSESSQLSIEESVELDLDSVIGDFLGFEIWFPDGSASVVDPKSLPQSGDRAAGTPETLASEPELEVEVADSDRFEDPRDPESAFRLPEPDSVLDFAVASGSCALVRKLLLAGADPNSVSSAGSTLQRAVLVGDPDMVAMLLAYGGSADLAVDTTPLILASQSGNSALVAQLIEMKANVDVRDKVGLSPIVAAAAGGHWRVVEKLLAAGVDLEVATDAADPIVVAAHGGHRQVVEQLLPKVGEERRRRAEELLAGSPRRSRATVSDGEMLVAGAQLGDLEEVERILELGVDVDYVAENGCTAVMAAVTYGFPKLVDYLLEWNADVNLVCQKEPHPTPLIMAASSFFIEDRPALIGRLIQSGADVEAQDARGQTALMATMTLGEGYRDALLALIEFGADVGARDHDGNTALMHAIQGGYNELARILRSEEAERDGLEEIALLEACEQSNLDAVTDLILAGADVNYRCGWTPLMVAASKGSIDIVDMLLKVGADPDRGASEEHGEPYTPLLLAAHRGHLEVVERLIEAGVDLEVRIDDVGGALDYALVGRHEARERCDEGETFDQDGHWSRLVSLLESKTCVRQDRKRTGERAATRIVA